MIGIILQARLNSKRLPRKVLLNINGKTMLECCLERLNKVKADKLILATPDKELLSYWSPNFLGSEDDVLDRYYMCARYYKLDHIVRATADNPLVNIGVADELVDFHIETGSDYSYTEGLPIGAGVEVFTFNTLERSWFKGLKPNHREHVNEYILENPELFNISILKETKFASNLRLTVDTLEDMRNMRYICKLVK